MRSARVLFAAAAALSLAGCGSSSSSSGGSSSHLVAKVSGAEGKIEGHQIVGSAEVRVGGGTPGRQYTLEWGIIDAVAGVRASDAELVAARFTTTSKVEQKDVTVHAKIPGGTTAYLVHFVLNGPDGAYVSSSDSAVFQADGS